MLAPLRAMPPVACKLGVQVPRYRGADVVRLGHRQYSKGCYVLCPLLADSGHFPLCTVPTAAASRWRSDNPHLRDFSVSLSRLKAQFEIVPFRGPARQVGRLTWI